MKKKTKKPIFGKDFTKLLEEKNARGSNPNVVSGGLWNLPHGNSPMFKNLKLTKSTKKQLEEKASSTKTQIPWLAINFEEEPNTRHLEIEIKWDAKKVNWDLFVNYFRSLDPKDEILVMGPDQYWKNDKSVLRYRSDLKKFHQLTVKTRTSETSTSVRGECDLNLKGIKLGDVEAFLSMLGYEQEITLIKRCHIFKLEWEGFMIVPVIYEVWDVKTPDVKRRFIEVEIEKSKGFEESKAMLEVWKKKIHELFGLSQKNILNDSLYEIFTNNKYRVVK